MRWVFLSLRGKSQAVLYHKAGCAGLQVFFLGRLISLTESRP